MAAKARYHKLTKTDGKDGDIFTDLQFQKPEPKIPWKAIGVAFGLLFVGSTLIIIGSFLLAGYIDEKYKDRTWPVLVLGILTFLPGFYHIRIAYYSWMGYPGYSFDDILVYAD